MIRMLAGRRLVALSVVFGLGIAVPAARADEVLDWNAILIRSVNAAGVPGALQGRLYAIVHASIFDAVNGIERRFTPIHVSPDGPKGASRRAAAVQAAFTALAALFPAQADALEADLESSLAAISSEAAAENSTSIARGRLWGEEVALEILAWRAADGLNPPGPPYLGSMTIGKWRPTPPGFLPGLAPTMATTTPWVIPDALTFRPLGPPPLPSPEYAASVNEIQDVGSLASATRTADQTESALFWAATAFSFWNRAATSASIARHLTLSDNARLFAVLNVAIADAIIVAWDSKYFFELWRPITAIRMASTDGNPATNEDMGWTPLIVTPPYPEYYSGHQSVSRTSAEVLTAYFGDQMPVSGFSEGLPNVVRAWPSFRAAADEALMARIWAGIHFRFAMLDTREVAEQIASYVLAHAARPVNGQHSGQLPD